MAAESDRDDTDQVYVKTNREKRMTPKKGIFWCDHCDAQMVAEWERCPVCGLRSGIKRHKKEKI